MPRMSDLIMSLKISEAASEASMAGLTKSTFSFDGGSRAAEAQVVTIRSGQFYVMPGVKTVTARSEVSSGWEQTIVFTGIDISTEKDRYHPIRIGDQKENKEYFIAPISYNNTKVLVRCSCPDFRHTFAYYVKDQLKALAFGALAPYVRKTTTRPPRNPNHIPGLCKHLLALNNYLANNNLYTG